MVEINNTQTIVTAPISGKVESCEIEALDRVSASNPICVISGEGNKIVTSQLTDSLRRELQIGDEVRMEKTGKNYTGTISELSEMVDGATGLYEMFEICEKGYRLLHE